MNDERTGHRTDAVSVVDPPPGDDLPTRHTQEGPTMTEHSPLLEDRDDPIAVIGMAARVPGADNLEQFWANLCDGVESIRFFGPDEALAAGASKRAVQDPQHVFAAPILDHIEDFDAPLFGFTPREAEILDPQHRVLLECARSALEHAGYDPARYPGTVGVYTGIGSGEYQWYHLLPDRSLVAAVGHMAIALANNPDYTSTLISYKLNLTGPSMAVSTACSTGLVAVHLAAEAVRNGECDMALAGAASVELMQWHGYTFHEGSILSPDGHCRAFDEDAQGTLWGSGGGIVVLKRLSDAIADGDTVHGLILATAVNNDGSAKVGFSAPSVSGQSAVIRQALELAGVPASSIGYVEAHGTGTNVGDPIEVRALNEALTLAAEGDDGAHRGPGVTTTGIGSVKPNVGHLAAAAGVAGLIKGILSLEREQIPPTLHFQTPNPAMEIESTRLRVIAALEPWPRTEHPRRAGVSSFGMGGTNAHAILEEAPPAPREGDEPEDPQLVLLSARTPTALDATTADLAQALRAQPDLPLADVAFTMAEGRARLAHRTAFVASGIHDAADVLERTYPRRLFVGTTGVTPRPVFAFPGQGTQRVGMARELYGRYDVVRHWIDEGARLLLPHLGYDLRDVVFADDDVDGAAARLRQTGLTQPALFVVEYALAKLWQRWGVEPAAMIGHSLGEYVAATLAGVFDYADALRVVAARGALIESLPGGGMLALPVDEATVAIEGTGLDLAAVNAPMATVVSGPYEQLAAYEEMLADLGVPATRLQTSHAFHSRMLEPVRQALADVLAGVTLRAPQLPVVSCLTGTWLTAAQATDPSYWADQMCSPVRFADGLRTALEQDGSVLVEVGPGEALTGLARMQLPPQAADPIATLPARAADEVSAHLEAVARLWTLGVEADLSAGRRRAGRRVPLPGHPFERQRCWIDWDPDAVVPGMSAGVELPQGRQDVDDWFWTPVWRQTPALGTAVDPEEHGDWLLVTDPRDGIDWAPLRARLQERSVRLAVARIGQEYAGGAADGADYTLRPDAPKDAERLIEDVVRAGLRPRMVIHAGAIAPGGPLDPQAAARAVAQGFTAPVHVLQALAAAGLAEGTRHVAVTCGSLSVVGGDVSNPAGAVVTGPVRTAPTEFVDLTFRHLDVDDPTAVPDVLLAELGRDERVVAYRSGRRWIVENAPVDLPGEAADRAALRDEGVYLITGGAGGIGLSVAEELAQRVGARIALLSRRPMPGRQDWARLARGADARARTCAALLRIEAAGGRVLTLAADVTDPVALEGVRSSILAEFGRLDGIVHAAGIAGGTMTEVQTAETAQAVLAPKVSGTLALAQVFGADELDFVVLCSSVTALLGGLGQVDYCAANAFMDAFAHAAEGRLPWPVLAVDWGAWLEVGMAVETPDPTRGQGGHAPQTALAESAGTPDLGVEPSAFPSAPAVRDDEDGARIGVVELGTEDWVVGEHRVLGLPTLPGTAHLELVRATFAAGRPVGPIELRDVTFLAPLQLADGERRVVRVSIDDADGGAWALSSQIDGVWADHSRGTVAWATLGPRRIVDVAAIEARCPTPREEQELAVSASGLVSFGPHWASLQAVSSGTGEELAHLEAPSDVAAELGEEPGRFWLHPAVLDEATACGDHPDAVGSYLPFGYGRIVIHGPMPARVSSHLVHHASGRDLVSSDITVLDEHGVAVVEIGDFMLRSVRRDQPVDLGTGPAAPKHPQVPGSDEQVGIRPAEGAAALIRVLGWSGGRQIAVTARHLHTLEDLVRRIVPAAESAPDEASGPGALVLSGTYVEPRTDIERALVSLWENALGVRGIGIEHDFFDLGGNSLAASQVIARIRAVMGVKIPMRTIFASPTIANLAPAVEAALELAS